jgi:hypothetical protein
MAFRASETESPRKGRYEVKQRNLVVSCYLNGSDLWCLFRGAVASVKSAICGRALIYFYF